MPAGDTTGWWNRIWIALRRWRQPVSPDFSAAQVIPRALHTLSRQQISPNALKVLNRLHHARFEAYLVGGGVRDLLLQTGPYATLPKDFDIATNARPEEVRKLFRNCRLIGRRFRLAHVYFNDEIIEVATFRAAEQVTAHTERLTRNGMIVRDNVYGTLSEDVWRRDFTVNALYYNIADFSIVDYTGGFADLGARCLRLIGDPRQRYAEDPVRMLRACRFKAKLNFNLDPATEAPLNEMAPLLAQVPAARLFEESLKLFQTGHAYLSYAALKQYKLLPFLLPSLAPLLETSEACRALVEATLYNTDARVRENKTLHPAFFFAALLWHPLQLTFQTLQKERSHLLGNVVWEEAIQTVLQAQTQAVGIPKRLTRIMREIWGLQGRLAKRQGKRPFRTLSHPRFRAAYDFLLLRAEVGDATHELAEWWTAFQSVSEKEQDALIRQARRA